jgi:hypothetical protein
VNQDSQAPLKPLGTRIAITYRGIYGPITTKVTSETSIQERKSVEGGTGIYEAVDNAGSLDGLEVVIEKSRGDLRRYSTLDDEIKFETDLVGLAIGQTVDIDLPALDCATKSMLITQMETSLFGVEQRRHQVTATTGELKNTYHDFFRKFFSRGVDVSISPDDVINEVAAAIDTASITDLVSLTTDTAHIGVVDVDLVGMAEVG